jgi:hypothetical protein
MNRSKFYYSFLIFFVLIGCSAQNNKKNHKNMIQEDSLPKMDKNKSDYTYHALGVSYTIGESVDTDTPSGSTR